MGAANSKVEDDKAMQICRERKKFVRQALDGRCSLASSHVAYIQSLRSVGTALRKFVEPEATSVCSPYACSTNATPESFVTYHKTRSHFSFPSPTVSNTKDLHDNPTPSPLSPRNPNFEINQMQFRGFSSTKVEEKLPDAVTVTLTSSSTPTENTPRSVGNSDASPFDEPTPPPGTPWDFFGLSQQTNDEFSFQEVVGGSETNEDMKSLVDEAASPRDHLVNGVSDDSGDEFDDHPAETLVRSFRNLNRVPENTSAEGEKVDFENGGEIHSTHSTPLKRQSSTHHDYYRTTPAREDQTVHPELHRDFGSSLREIEHLFFKASETGKEVPRMLEANKLHFRPLIPGKEGGAAAFFKSCFSCGDEAVQVQEEPADQKSVKYLTWHRTSSYNSSRSPISLNPEAEEASNNLFDNTCMISGSHASTLDRLYAWERKLYDEVKVVRRDYDTKCKVLRQLESKGEPDDRVYKMRADVKDLHSRIRVAIQRIDSISTRIEELRDKELQPQLVELIKGLSRMWKGMSECHKMQLQIMSSAHESGTNKMPVQGEPHRQITLQLANELSSLSSCFMKWMASQKAYLTAINDWLFKCVFIPQNTKKRRSRQPTPSAMLRDKGPSMYSICGVWLDESTKLPSKEVVDAIKGLAAEIDRFLPLHDKTHAAADGPNPGADTVREHESEDCVSRFKSSLVGFLGQLSKFADCSVAMYAQLETNVAARGH